MSLPRMPSGRGRGTSLAAAHGLLSALSRYPREESPVADALTYADQTIGPHGQRLTLDERIADTLARHGPDSPHARVHHQRDPYLHQIADRVEQRLATIGTRR